MEPVVRMFTSATSTVRWETSIAGSDGLEFRVSGPDGWRNSKVFPDSIALLRFQAEYERFLRENGYQLSLVNDRRWRRDRRQRPRLGRNDRRK
jgi:hypothetical protein